MDCDEAGSSNVRVMTRRQLFNIMQQQNIDNISKKLDFLENHLLNLDDFSDELVKEIKHKFSRFKHEMKQRWSKARRTEEIFITQNKEWLDGTFDVPKMLNRQGRPSKTFSDSSERSKRRKTEELRRNTDLEVLTFATQAKLSETGKRDASLVLKNLTTLPKRATKYKRAFSLLKKKSTFTSQITATEALSIFVEAGLLRRQYEIIRSVSKKMYPSYSILQKSKLECYPDKEAYRVTETCAEIKLQTLMDHTVTRLLKHLEDVLMSLSEKERGALVLMCKWGCDGAQQAQYKQKFENDYDSDANLFQSSFVPLQLICSLNNIVVWQNPTPSSPRYCRPIRMRFIKETNDVIKEEISYIKDAINALRATTVTISENVYSVKHTMMLTMIDGKVCNAATNTTSTMKCYICGLTSKDFNNLNVTREVNQEALAFGLSILHARIRLFESIIHLSYKQVVKKWQLRTEAEKTAVKQRKAEIQKEFREKMGLIVDVPKPGYGNTNDGNTSRRFFADHELAAEITQIDVNLIYRLKVILEIISSGHKVNIDMFSVFTKETAELYVNLYSWHPMTPTMHKILMHGPIVIEKALLPIGQLSEEAAEARNKHIRLYRHNYSRKFSRVSCNMDVLNRLLLSSDPLITGMRPVPKRKSKPFSNDTLTMLLPAVPNVTTLPDREESSEDEEDFSDEEEPWDSSSSSY